MDIFIPKGKYKDKSGERIHWEKPYFDPAFRREFKSEEEKRDYMNNREKPIISTGQMDSDDKRLRKELEAHKYQEKFKKERRK